MLAHVSNESPLAGDVTPRERALVRYVIKLTRTPADMAQADVASLRDAGLDDAEVLDTVHVAGYYAYANRLADGLGLALEPYRGG